MITLLDSLFMLSITLCLCHVDTANYVMYGIWLHRASLRKVLSHEKKVVYILHSGVKHLPVMSLSIHKALLLQVAPWTSIMASNGRLGMRLLGLTSILLNLKSCTICQKHWAKVPDHLAWHTVSNSCSNSRRKLQGRQWLQWMDLGAGAKRCYLGF